jgi:hypothetical protein
VGVVTLAVLVAASILVRRGRLESRHSLLAPRERIRPLAITLLDPIVSVVIIGPFVAHFARSSPSQLLGALVGATAGVALGYLRARIMFVRAIRATKSIVLRRSGLEYGLVAILIVLRLLQGPIERSHASVALAGLTALASLALLEALARSAFIVQRYRLSPHASPATEGPDSLT